MEPFLSVDGLIPVLPTPFTESGDLHEELLHAEIEFFVNSGLKTVLIAGTTGEYFGLSIPQRLRCIEVVRQAAAAKELTVIANGTASTLREQIMLGRELASAGADALINIPILATQLTCMEFQKFWSSLCEGLPSNLPIFIYNLASVNQLPSIETLVDTLNCNENIIGTKEGHTDIDRWARIQSQTSASVIPADDFKWIEYHLQGCKAFMTPTISIFPALCIKLEKLIKTNPEHPEAYRIVEFFKDFWANIILSAQFSDYHQIAKVKACCRLMGNFHPGYCSDSLIDLPDPCLKTLEKHLHELASRHRIDLNNNTLEPLDND